MRMGDLAEALTFSRSRMSHAITRLEQNGWIRREQCAEDRRGSVAVLTDAGLQALEAAAPQHVESVRAPLFAQLAPEEARDPREGSETLGALPPAPVDIE